MGVAVGGGDVHQGLQVLHPPPQLHHREHRPHVDGHRLGARHPSPRHLGQLLVELDGGGAVEDDGDLLGEDPEDGWR